LVQFLVDDYGSALSPKIPQIEAELTHYNISYRTRKYHGIAPHLGGWVNFSDLSLKYSTIAEQEDRFSKCAQIQKFGHCFPFPIVGGKVYPCPALRRCVELGKVEETPDTVLNLFDADISIECRQNWFTSFNKIKSLKACAYCYGMCDDSPRVPPGEQL
jgi:hypothetical protein